MAGCFGSGLGGPTGGSSGSVAPSAGAQLAPILSRGSGFSSGGASPSLGATLSPQGLISGNGGSSFMDMLPFLLQFLGGINGGGQSPFPPQGGPGPYPQPQQQGPNLGGIPPEMMALLGSMQPQMPFLEGADGRRDARLPSQERKTPGNERADGDYDRYSLPDVRQRPHPTSPTYSRSFYR